MPTVTPSLWFNGNLEEAVAFYTDLFPDSTVGELSRWGPNQPGPEGTALAASFVLAGQRFNAINGGPEFPFTEAVSFVLTCADQAEIDHYWEALLAKGGEESQCGWLRDRFGLSWQVIPADLPQLLARPGAMDAMMGMRKLVVAELLAAT